jgi:hypothetical protein
VIRGIPDGEAKEAAISKLAAQLQAPNFCKVALGTGPDSFPPLKGHTVAVAHWLNPSETVASLSQPDIDRLRQSQSLLRQLGQWAAFAALFGVRDRGSANWVVDLDGERLSMIDNEASFEASTPSELQWFVDLFGLDRARLRAQKRGYAEATPLIQGMETMAERHLDELAAVRQILSDHAFCAQFTPPYPSFRPPNEISTALATADDIIDRVG